MYMYMYMYLYSCARVSRYIGFYRAFFLAASAATQLLASGDDTTPGAAHQPLLEVRAHTRDARVGAMNCPDRAVLPCDNGRGLPLLALARWQLRDRGSGP